MDGSLGHRLGVAFGSSQPCELCLSSRGPAHRSTMVNVPLGFADAIDVLLALVLFKNSDAEDELMIDDGW